MEDVDFEGARLSSGAQMEKYRHLTAFSLVNKKRNMFGRAKSPVRHIDTPLSVILRTPA